MTMLHVLIAGAIAHSFTAIAVAQDNSEELAKKFANPIAALIDWIPSVARAARMAR
jgi:hypothetical protein